MQYKMNIVGSVIHGKNIDYTILKFLGEGTYGMTYLAEGNDGLKYAVKQFKKYEDFIKQGYSDATAFLMMKQMKNEIAYETKILSIVLQICNEHASCFIELIDDDSHETFIVMEYITGQNVQNAIFGENKIPLNERRANGQNFIKDMVMGLNAIHALNLIHQDIKGANLMYTKDKKVKYIDFGLSCFYNTDMEIDGIKIFGAKNWPCGSPGTLTTAPPEMCLHSGNNLVLNNNVPTPDNGIYNWEYLLAHDIWSIGCEILSWYAVRDKDFINNWLNYTYTYSFYQYENDFRLIFEDIRNYDEIAYKVICGLLHRDPQQRIKNFEEIASYYLSWFGTLKNYENTWNRYDITGRVRDNLISWRCSIADKVLIKFSSLYYSSLGVSLDQCMEENQKEIVLETPRMMTRSRSTLSKLSKIVVTEEDNKYSYAGMTYYNNNVPLGAKKYSTLDQAIAAANKSSKLYGNIPVELTIAPRGVSPYIPPAPDSESDISEDNRNESLLTVFKKVLRGEFAD